jgi:Rrf2 family iron-sulfur cluster assembly transcriptional regulator
MRLEVTRRADLATRALTALAGAGRRVKAKDLAEQLETTTGFVPQVLNPLIERGWVRSDPGPTGGYSSLVPVAELTVLDVIEAVDGPTDTGRCVVADRPCGRDETCVLHCAWEIARARLLEALAQTSVAELAETGGPGRDTKDLRS